MTEQPAPSENKVESVSNLDEAVSVLIQGALLAVNFRTPDGKSILGLQDANAIGQSIDFLHGKEKATPKVPSATVAVSVLMQAVHLAQEHGAFTYSDARLLGEAIDFITVPANRPGD